MDGQVYRKSEAMKRGHGERNTSSERSFYGPRLLVSIDDAFDVISKVHDEFGHDGKNKTFEVIEERYYGIIRDDVSYYCLLHLLYKYTTANSVN